MVNNLSQQSEKSTKPAMNKTNNAYNSVPKMYSTVVKSSENRVPLSAAGKSASAAAAPNHSNSDSGGGTKPMSDEDKKINLNTLKNNDPFASNLLDSAQRVAVYKFLSKKNEWKKLDVEGSLFLFERMVEPLHSFVVMNTLALNLFLQPITAELDVQDRNPFLLYKSNNDIFGIWFLDASDCQRIKNLILW